MEDNCSPKLDLLLMGLYCLDGSLSEQIAQTLRR